MKRRDEPAGCSQAIEAPLKMDTAGSWLTPLCGHLQSLMTPRGGHEEIGEPLKMDTETIESNA